MMSRKPDYVQRKFGPLADKTLQNAVAYQISHQFPRIGGPRIQQLCAEILLETISGYLLPREHVHHGQILWMAVSIDDPPSRGKRMKQTKLVPVILDVMISEDIEARIERKSAFARLQTKAVRLCHQSYDQGGLLSNCDLAEILNCSDSLISTVLKDYEVKQGSVLPRRATLHDMGTGLSHKRIICLKRYGEGKSPDVIARETYHSLEAVDRYLGHYARVRQCRLQGLTPERISYTLNCSLSLVNEYLSIDKYLENIGK